MKALLLTLTALFFVIFTKAQDIEAPVNPEFIKFQQSKNTDNGDIPFYEKPNFDFYLNSENLKNIQFESIYDLRNENLVTGAKNQGACGCCWTFATIGSIESYWLKNGYGEFDLSEQNIRTCHGFYTDIDGSCTGGNPKKSTAYLTRGQGPVLETDDSYNTDEYETCTYGYTPVAYIGDFRIFPGDEATIKQAVLDYGALYVNMYYSSSYLNYSNYTYYYSGSESTNHAVLLVGWDDTKETDGGTGAWIIKNSYGTSYGENGFFYLSYNDSQALSTNACFPSRNDFDSLETIYMYDELGWLSSTGYSTETAYGLTKFVATSDQLITKIGTYVNTAKTSLSFVIYDNKSGNTLSGILGTYTPDTCDFPGYYSFALPSSISIESGNDFYIKVKYNTPGYTYPIPLEKYIAEYADPTIESGVNWISSSGTSWTAIGNDISGKERDLCIRAYGIPNTTSISDISTSNIDFNIFPTPAKNQITISFDQNLLENTTCHIYDINGKEVWNSVLLNNQYKVDISSFAKGIYYVKINEVSKTFIKE